MGSTLRSRTRRQIDASLGHLLLMVAVVGELLLKMGPSSSKENVYMICIYVVTICIRTQPNAREQFAKA